jgi:hypothetical protein
MNDPIVIDRVMSGFCFWLLLAVSLGFAICGFWSPCQLWLGVRKPPQLNNFIFLCFLLLLLYFLVGNLQQGLACTGLSCVPLYHRDVPEEADIYWYLTGINALVALFVLWGVLANHGQRFDEKQQKKQIDTETAQRTQHATHIKAAWDATGGSVDFIAALKTYDLHCAMQDDVYVVLDKTGALYQLDFDTLNETKTAIHDTLTANLQGSGVVVLSVVTVKIQLAAAMPSALETLAEKLQSS